MNLPRISIITPSYNQGQFIERTILSVLNQNYPNLEHIIIDGGSKDNTIEILKKYSHLIWVSEPDRGQSDALNKGLKMASGEIIGWLNSDDIYLPGTIYKIAEIFVKNQDVSVVYGDCYYIDEQDRIIRKYRSRDFDLKKLLTSCYCYIPSVSAFIKKKVFDNLEYPFDVNLHYCMDYDLFIRIAIAGFKFKYVPEFFAAFRRSKHNKTTLYIKLMRKESFTISVKYGGGKYLSLHTNYMLAKMYLSIPFLTNFARKIRYKLSLLLR
jgi:glycosyltransferase involved in cell wall biosynthesis